MTASSDWVAFQRSKSSFHSFADATARAEGPLRTSELILACATLLAPGPISSHLRMSIGIRARPLLLHFSRHFFRSERVVM
eukprot:4027070-Prymnesium_polylepis.1